MTDAEKKMTRKQRFEALAEKLDLDLDDFGLDEYSDADDADDAVPRFAAFEINTSYIGEDYAPWAYLDHTLAALESSLSDSETQRESIEVYDLDTLKSLDTQTRVIITRPDGYTE